MCQQTSQAEGATATHPRMRHYEERCVFVVEGACEVTWGLVGGDVDKEINLFGGARIAL